MQKLWLRFPGDVGAETSAAAQGQLRAAIEQQRNLPQELVDLLPFSLPQCPEGDELKGLVPFEREDLPLRRLGTEQWRQVLRQQFPFTPAMADTLHSSQGSSYDAACVEYHEGMRNDMVYVGMSRVRSLAGLFINYTGKNRTATGSAKKDENILL